MARLHVILLVLVLFLRFGELLIVVTVEVFVLQNVRILDFFLSLLMSENKLLILHVELLLFQFQNSVLGHFCLYVSTIFLAGLPVIFHSFNEISYVVSVNLSVLAAVLTAWLLSLHSLFLNLFQSKI